MSAITVRQLDSADLVGVGYMTFNVADEWYKAVLAAGVVLAGAAVAVGHDSLLICGLGLIFWGIGEFINHPYQEQIVPGPPGTAYLKIAGRSRKQSVFGLLIDAAGAALILFGVWKMLTL